MALFRHPARWVVTAGPTREAVDPVRFLSNRSTGTLGFLIAAAARKRGHRVTLISGPVERATPAGVRRVDVESARQMERAVRTAFRRADGLVMTAAVGDFRAAAPRRNKIRRGAGDLKLKLVLNPDIVAKAARSKRPGQVVIGAALESGSPLAGGLRKLRDKGLDGIVATGVTGAGRGPFGQRPISGWLIGEGSRRRFRNWSKGWLAGEIVRMAERLLDQKMVAGRGRRPRQ